MRESKRNNLVLIFYFIVSILSLNSFSNKALSQSEFYSDVKQKELFANLGDEEISEPFSYRLGPGDVLRIQFYGLPEFSSDYFISPDGKLFLPEIKFITVENMTLKELDKLLHIKYKDYLNNPQINIEIINFRPVRVYVKGEISRPGFYTLSGVIDNNNIKGFKISTEENSLDNQNIPEILNPSMQYSSALFPTVFDAIKASQGVTPYSDLSKVEVIRKVGHMGNEKIKASLNFLELIMEGNQSQNIRVLDGDTIVVSKSKNILKEQIASTLQTNISPDILQVYVSGNVITPGLLYLPSGAGLNQAIAQAGGKKILSGQVEFLRFNDNLNVDKRKFNFDLEAKKNTYKNPILMNGDLINVKKSLLGSTTAVVGEITKPILGIYTLFNIIEDF